MGLLDGCQRIMFAHAHPDDETLSTGVLIASLSAQGHDVRLVTATRGERGQVVDGPLAWFEGKPGLRRVRELELGRAAEALGISQVIFLGMPPARSLGLQPRYYTDSGMRWVSPGVAGPDEDVGPEAFTKASVEEAADDLGALIHDAWPDVLITYDELGGYQHPDHVHLHDVCVAAAHRTGVRLLEVLSPDTQRRPGDETLTLGEHLPEVTKALHAHATQVRVDGKDVIHSGGQRQPIVTTVTLREHHCELD